MSSPKRLPISREEATQLVGVVAAVLVAVFANVLAARHYKRWDWTGNNRYTLSSATVQTLRDLSDPIQVWVLVGSADPLEQSVKQLLVAYQAETTKLDVHYVDPDRDTVALEDVRKRFKIETGRTENGHVVADAVVVVARGERHWFLTTEDMIQASATDDTRVKPREEQALTGAIRNVLGAEKTKLCFTTGHGEMSPLDPSEVGVGLLKEVLVKDNYEITTVDSAAPSASEPFKGCAVAVIAGMRGAFTKDEVERLRTFLLEGGNLLLAASPLPGETPTGLTPTGLDRALAPFGIALDDDLVVEDDADLAFPGAGGIRFVASPKSHPVTAGIVKGDSGREVPRVVVHFTRSMHRVAEASAAPRELLVTSAKAFGLTSIVGAADWKDAPTKRPSDLGGPLVVAMASERPRMAPSSPHGPRALVLGSASVLTATTFREPLPLRGAALLVESGISWLASKPQVLDVPERSAVPAGIRITDDSRSEIRRYVVIFMPATVALLGVAMAVFRRGGKTSSPKASAKGTKPRKNEKTANES